MSDAVAALDQSYACLDEVVSGLGSEQLALPTPCADFDVRGVLNHALAAAQMFTDVNAGRSIEWLDNPVDDESPQSVVSRFRQANLAAWRGPAALEGDRVFPFGTFPAQVALCINVGEIAVHAWDIGAATGQSVAIDDVVIDLVLGFYQNAPLDAMRKSGAFGPAVAVPPGASSQDTLLGLLGREAKPQPS